MKISTVIVDDEPLARKGLFLRLAEFENIDIVGECKKWFRGSNAYSPVTP